MALLNIIISLILNNRVLLEVFGPSHSQMLNFVYILSVV